jgi:hypothetical protein
MGSKEVDNVAMQCNAKVNLSNNPKAYCVAEINDVPF